MKVKALARHTPMVEEIADDFTDLVRSTLDPQTLQTPNNFEEYLYRWALESVTSLVLDKRFGCLDRDLGEDSDQIKMIHATGIGLQEIFELEVLNGIFQWCPPLFKSYRTLSVNYDLISSVTKDHISHAIAESKTKNRSSYVFFSRALLCLKGI